MSLYQKIFLSFLGVALLLLVTLLALHYNEQKIRLEQTWLETLKSDARKLADRIDMLITANMDTIKHLSYDRTLQRFLFAPERDQRALRDTMNTWLDEQVMINPELYSAFYVLNPYGRCLASSERTFIGENYSFRPYFQEAVLGNVFLTDLFIGVTSHVAGIYVSAPVFDEEEIIGVLVLKFRADKIFAILRSFEYEQVQSIVINKMGIILSHSKPDFIHRSLTPLSTAEKQYIHAIRQFSDHPITPLNMPELKETLFNTPLADAITTSYVLDNEERIGGFAALTSQEWIVGVSKPLSEIHELSKRLIQKTVLVAGLSILIIAIVAHILSTYVLIQPINKLVEATKRISSGQYTHRITPTSQDEIGTLANAFNMMAYSLQQSEEDYRDLFEHLNVGVYRNTGGARGRFLRVNPAFVDMFGYGSIEEILNIAVSDLYQNPEDRQHFVEHITKHGGVRNMELAMKKKNGEFLWGSATATVHYDKAGNVKWIDGIVEDITKRKRTEEALRESEAKIRAVLNAIPDLMFILNKDGVFLEYTEEIKADDLYLPPGEYLGKHVQEVLPPWLSKLTMEHVKRVLQSAQVQVYEYQLPIRDSMRHFEARMILSAKDQIVCIIRDITERKRAEEEVRKHRRDLQKLSAQLIDAQEAERRKISRELHDEMGQALVAMRLNLGTIERSLPSELPSSIGERLAETKSAVDQTLTHVRELSLTLRPFMLDDFGLVPALRSYINRYAKRLNIDITFEVIDLDTRLNPEIETAFYRVIQEALTNVAKHTQASKVSICLERKMSTITAYIEDNGHGFDLQNFEEHKILGQEIGLLGMQERVSNLGGTFHLQSHLGQGTRISIEIPILKNEKKSKFEARNLKQN